MVRRIGSSGSEWKKPQIVLLDGSCRATWIEATHRCNSVSRIGWMLWNIFRGCTMSCATDMMYGRVKSSCLDSGGHFRFEGGGFRNCKYHLAILMALDAWCVGTIVRRCLKHCTVRLLWLSFTSYKICLPLECKTHANPDRGSGLPNWLPLL